MSALGGQVQQLEVRGFHSDHLQRGPESLLVALYCLPFSGRILEGLTSSPVACPLVLVVDPLEVAVMLQSLLVL